MRRPRLLLRLRLLLERRAARPAAVAIATAAAAAAARALQRLGGGAHEDGWAGRVGRNIARREQRLRVREKPFDGLKLRIGSPHDPED